MHNRRSGYILFLLSIIIAMALRIAPWFGSFSVFTPDWILLVLIYWSQTSPHRYGVLNAWLIGLFTDVLTGKLLGQHALAYALVVYCCIRLHRQLRQFELFQQSLFIFFGLILSNALISWTQNQHGPTMLELAFWYPVFSGLFFWPVIYIAMHSICIARKII